jgi:hypothetical protein
VFVEVFHVVVGLFADDEQSDGVVGVEVDEVVNIRGYVFEDKHDVVPIV